MTLGQNTNHDVSTRLRYPKAHAMFSFLKADPSKKLNKAYRQKLEQAMIAQRNGNIRGYSLLTEEAEELRLQIEALPKGE